MLNKFFGNDEYMCIDKPEMFKPRLIFLINSQSNTSYNLSPILPDLTSEIFFKSILSLPLPLIIVSCFFIETMLTLLCSQPPATKIYIPHYLLHLPDFKENLSYLKGK